MKKHHCTHCNERIHQIYLPGSRTRWVATKRWANPDHGNPFTCKPEQNLIQLNPHTIELEHRTTTEHQPR